MPIAPSGRGKGISPIPEVETSGFNPLPFQGKERYRIIFLMFINLWSGGISPSPRPEGALGRVGRPALSIPPPFQGGK